MMNVRLLVLAMALSAACHTISAQAATPWYGAYLVGGSAVDPALSASKFHPDSHRVTADIRLHSYMVKGHSTSGALAVIDPAAIATPVAGIQTALSGIYGLSRGGTDEVVPGHDACVIYCGRFAGGSAGIGAYLWDGVGVPTNSGVVTFPIVGQPGEIFLAAGIVGDFLYVLEGSSPKIIRFSDSNGDALYDQRDAVFCFDGTGGRRVPSAVTFISVDDGVVGVPIPGSFDVDVIKTNALGGLFVERTSRLPIQGVLSSDNVVPTFRSRLSAGVSAIRLHGSEGHEVYIQKWAQASSEWITIKSIDATGKPQAVDLPSALVGGETLRLLGPCGASSEKVAAIQPVIDIWPGSKKTLRSGVPLVLSGQNLQIVTGVHFVDFKGKRAGEWVTYPCTIASSSPDSLTVTLPLAGPGGLVGRVILEVAGVKSGSTEIRILP